MTKTLTLLLVCGLALTAVGQETETTPKQTETKQAETNPENETADIDSADESETPAALNFKMKDLNGKEVDLSKYAGKVVVVVNTASKCGLTPQYEQLQQLHSNMSEKGLAVVGFPCNQFRGQEPGTDQEIKTFCQKNYGVTFDMFSKVDVNGDDACDFYKYLKDQETAPKAKGEVTWNFEKFVIDKSGNVIARFEPREKVNSEPFMAVVNKALEADPSVPATK